MSMQETFGAFDSGIQSDVKSRADFKEEQSILSRPEDAMPRRQLRLNRRESTKSQSHQVCMDRLNRARQSLVSKLAEAPYDNAPALSGPLSNVREGSSVA